jgi:MOSC domain-containing protein YiiM
MNYSHTPLIVGLYTAPKSSAPMVGSDSIEAVVGRGLVGDRYFENQGIYSNVPGWGASVSLISREAIDAVNIGHQDSFTPEMLRRNLVTVGLDLVRLIGRDFRCGEALLRGIKPYPPCAYLARLIQRREVLKYFAYACGIGAEVIEGGIIRVGDSIRIVE